MEVVQTKALCKSYGQKRAVDNLSMSVHEGDIYGFIGKNGAGKSTALKMLCALAAPTSGQISIFGKPVSDSVSRKRTGILVESPGIYPNLSARENMMLKATCLGLVDEKQRTPRLAGHPYVLQKVQELLLLTGLSDTGKKKTKQFSMGMKQRLGIAMALLGNPDLLILDEPINGLDPEGMAEVRTLLLKLNQEKGITILLSSHILGELSKLATRYGVIRDGRMVQEITAQELEENCRDYLHVRVDKPKEAAVCLEQDLGIVRYEVRPGGQLLIFDICESDKVSRALTGRGIVVQELYLHRRDLEEYFLELMGGGENA